MRDAGLVLVSIKHSQLAGGVSCQSTLHKQCEITSINYLRSLRLGLRPVSLISPLIFSLNDFDDVRCEMLCEMLCEINIPATSHLRPHTCQTVTLILTVGFSLHQAELVQSL